MKCEEIREQMLELMTSEGHSTPEVEAHLHSCAACNAELQEMRKTMALLDEWEAPEPSPFFNTRLKARVREAEQEAIRPSIFSLQWLRKPVLATAAAAVLVIGGAGGYTWTRMHPTNTNNPVTSASAVEDLQVLQNDQDMLNNFDALDDGETRSDSAQ